MLTERLVILLLVRKLCIGRYRELLIRQPKKGARQHASDKSAFPGLLQIEDAWAEKLHVDYLLIKPRIIQLLPPWAWLQAKVRMTGQTDVT